MEQKEKSHGTWRPTPRFQQRQTLSLRDWPRHTRTTPVSEILRNHHAKGRIAHETVLCPSPPDFDMPVYEDGKPLSEASNREEECKIPGRGEVPQAETGSDEKRVHEEKKDKCDENPSVTVKTSKSESGEKPTVEKGKADEKKHAFVTRDPSCSREAWIAYYRKFFDKVYTNPSSTTTLPHMHNRKNTYSMYGPSSFVNVIVDCVLFFGAGMLGGGKSWPICDTMKLFRIPFTRS